MDRLNETPKRVVVVGAGIVGAACALTLQRQGHQVTLVDGDQPGMGCSSGNGGAISPDFCVPMSMPGMLKRVPGWVSDPLGPLYLDWRHVPRALPWLLRWVAAGRPARVKQISAAMRALHAPALDLYQDLLGNQYDELIEKTGQLYVWRNPASSASEHIARDLRESHGVAVQSLDAAGLRALDPALAEGFVRRANDADLRRCTSSSQPKQKRATEKAPDAPAPDRDAFARNRRNSADDQALARHLRRLRQPHQLEQRRGDVGQATVGEQRRAAVNREVRALGIDSRARLVPVVLGRRGDAVAVIAEAHQMGQLQRGPHAGRLVGRLVHGVTVAIAGGRDRGVTWRAGWSKRAPCAPEIGWSSRLRC